MKLSEEQWKAIESVEGVTLLLAVPGSGKTTTLITRIGRMIYKQGIPPEKILVITYTRNATQDMRKRFSKLFGSRDADRIHFSTINSFCYSVVLRYAQKTGHKKPEDDIDQEYNIRKLYPSVYGNPFPNENDIQNLSLQITYAKNMGLSIDEVEGLKSDDLEVKPMYVAYQKFLKEHHKMDYDDQILFTQMIFRNNLDGLLGEFSDRFPYILLDEAQDTSKIQHEVIRLLSGKHGNLFMVGDEDQSIYGFRAAYPDALVNFKELYPDGRVFYLQTNFRSAQRIVGAASNVISNNQNRYDKQMKGSRVDEGILRFLNLQYRQDQYQQICKEIKLYPEETAILYRNNDSALPFISLFEREGIPYRCREMNTMFFSNKVIVDALDIINFALNPASKDLIWKIYYKLDLHIRKKTLYEATKKLNYKQRHPILMALSRHSDINKTQKKKIDLLMKQLDFIKNNDNAKDAVARVRSGIGYKNASSEKLFILEAIASDGESIPTFMNRLKSIENMIRSGTQQSNAKVILSTIHSSKGLEYEKVILVDAVNDILPNPESDIEEERRIFYVGITRAKNQLVMCNYQDFPGMFQREMYKEPVKTEEKQKKTSGTSRSKRSGSGKTKSDAGFNPGTLVKHKSFGTGRIVWIDEEKMIVDFGRKGKKTFLLSLVLQNDYFKRLSR